MNLFPTYDTKDKHGKPTCRNLRDGAYLDGPKGPGG